MGATAELLAPEQRPLARESEPYAVDSEVVALETLLELNTLLSRRIEEETARAVERERLLLRQTNCATMGEMTGIIAHQWRQPLASLSLILQNMRIDSCDGLLDATALDAYLNRAQRTIDLMAATIDDFRLFFTQNMPPLRFGLLGTMRKCAELMDASLKAHDIALSIMGDEVYVYGRENEFLHVLVNLVANAKEALVARRDGGGLIQIGVGQDGDEAWLCLCDNAGGIAAGGGERIFDPYFSTKQGGSGIGRTIVEQHMQGSIGAENWQQGTRFHLRVPVAHEERGG